MNLKTVKSWAIYIPERQTKREKEREREKWSKIGVRFSYDRMAADWIFIFIDYMYVYRHRYDSSTLTSVRSLSIRRLNYLFALYIIVNTSDRNVYMYDTR